MTPKPAPHIIHISSSDVSKVGSIIVIELTDDQQAIRVAQKLAAETGHRVTVRNERFALIETIPAASVHG